ncbi:MAG: autotransporter-associated beta strand repeat-containing protein, partial [Alphaproteobacteria bacterium]|nr:autotransporter-associated beta strand repeat-containing protein [Alphaproteobacteria bacterium]
MVTSATTLASGTYNGKLQSGYFVRSGSLTASNAIFTNYRTVGGSGSGGGAGFGGVLFINAGASAVRNNVTFTGNTAVGGASISGSVAGGTLNGGTLNNLVVATSNGSNGGTGGHYANSDSDFVVGDGAGNGVGGDPGYDGGNAVDGYGGHGGVGGYGTTGWGHNPILAAAVASATTAVAGATFDLEETIRAAASKGEDCAGYVAGAAAAAGGVVTAGLAGPFSDLAAEACTTTFEEAAAIVVAGVNLGFATNDLVFAGGALDKWNQDNNAGVNGLGGDGGVGGIGGAGSDFFGGGVGGNGGAGGAHGGPSARDGAGGDGGPGGIGGFGAGGGAGGLAGPGQGVYRGHDFSAANGDGGAAGFGGGIGSAGGAIDGGGTGGSGYGGSIFVADGGTLTITGNASFSRGNVVGGKSATGGVAGDAAGTDMFIMSGASVTLDPGAGFVQTFNGTIADDSIASIGNSGYEYGQGADVTIASGLVIFNGANTYSGQTIISGGTLQAQDGQGLFFNSNLNLNGGVFQTSGVFDRYVGTDSDRVQWTGSGGFSAVDSTGLTVTLQGGAQLVWAEDSFVPDGSALIFGSDVAGTGGVVTWTNDIDLNGADRTILVAANADNSDKAVITGVLSNGGLVIGDATHIGVLELRAVNTYSGNTTVNAGSTLLLTGSGSIANSAAIINNGVVDLSGTTTTSLVTLQGSGQINLGAATLVVTNGSTTFGGVIAGTGNLEIAGGNQSLTGTNTYTGATKIDLGGTLTLTGIGSIAASSGVEDNGSFNIAGTTTGAKIKTLSGTGAVSLGAQYLTITAGSTAFDGVIGGSGGLKITGGTQTLTGTNTYTGLTVIDAGDPPALALKGTGSIATSSGVVDNSMFDISQTTAGASITTLSGNGSVVLGGQRLTLTAAHETFAGVISGTGGLTVSGGTEALSGTNTFTGRAIVNTGAALILTGTGSIAAASGVTDNGTFDISPTTAGASIKSLSGTGGVTLGAQRLTLTAANDSFDGTISGSGGVTVA